MAAVVIHAHQLGPDLVQLVQAESGDLSLRNPSTGTERPVTFAEAVAFRRFSASDLSHFFAIADLPTGERPASRLAEVAQGLSTGLPTLTTLVDSTTMAAANLAVSGMMRPELLLDLSNLVHCCVFYDQVLLDYPPLGPPPQLVEIVQPLDSFTRNEPDFRWGVAVRRNAELQRGSAAVDELHASWQELLQTPAHVRMQSFDSITDSPSIRPYFPAGSTYGFYDPVHSATAGGSHDIDRAVSIQSFRFWINEKVAETLGVSYNCTSLRYPVERIAIRNRRRFRTNAEEILRALDPDTRPPDSDNSGGYLPRIRLPHALAIVLQRTRSLDGLWDEVLELRRQLTPLRETLQDAQLTRQPDGPLADKILRDVREVGTSASKIDMTIQAASKVAGGLTAEPAATASLKVASTLAPAQGVRRLVQRLRRPELKVVRTLAADLEVAMRETAQIERLWGTALDEDWVRVASRLTEAATRDHSRFRFGSA